MTCANRGLLQQMLAASGAEGDPDSDGGSPERQPQEDLGMSVRLIPGTPKAGTQVRNVPTISSPAAVRGRPTGSAAPPGVRSLQAPPPKAASAPPAKATITTIPTTITTTPVVKTGPAQNNFVSQPRPGSRGGLVSQVVTTGAPTSQGRDVEQPRPGSRGGLTPQFYSPSSGSRGGPPSSGARPAHAAASKPTGYAGMHMLRKATSPAGIGGGKAQPAAKPMCGPSAFAMLAKLDASKAAAAGEVDHDSVGAGAVTTERLSIEEEQDGDGLADEDGGFMMPDDSDGDSDESPHPQNRQNAQPQRPTPSMPPQVQQQEQIQQASFPPQRPLQPQPLQPQPLKQPAQQVRPVQPQPQPQLQPQLQQQQQDAGGAGKPGRTPPGPSADPVTGRPAAQGSSLSRSRSSDARSLAGPPGPLAGAAAAAGSQVRARSNDPRVAVAASRAKGSPTRGSDSDDVESSDDDEAVRSAGASAPGVPTPWKADIKSMVQEFAKEERARARPAGGSDAGEGTPKRKPPRAPRRGSSDGGGAYPSASAKFAVEEPAAPAPAKRAPPRKVEYTMATVEDYKEKYGAKGEMQQLGNLGPDLDDDDLLMKKAMQEKAKQFSKELHRINKHRADKAPPKPKPKPKVEPTLRDKMSEYAKNVPKPKVEPRPALLVEKEGPSAAALEQRRKPKEPPTDAQADWEEIRRREKQHFEDVAKVAQIKDFLSQLAV